MEMVKSVEAIVVQIEPRKNSRVCCSGCGRTASGYDHMSEARHFEFVPLWGMKVYFRYRMRRVNCRRCGVKKSLPRSISETGYPTNATSLIFIFILLTSLSD